MIDRLRLVAIPTVEPLVLLLLTRLALCEDRGSLLEVLPISLPPSELWCVVLLGFQARFTELDLGMATMVRGPHSHCKWVLRLNI